MKKPAFVFCSVLLLILGCHMLGTKPPQSLSPENGAEITDATPLLSWSPCDSVDNYRIVIALDKNLHIIIQDTFTYVTQLQIVDSLNIGDSRYWMVGAVSHQGVLGPWSKIHTFKRIKANTL